MPQKEELAISKVAYSIFPWQVERVLHLNFPGKVSRAEEDGFCKLYYVSVVHVCVSTLTVD